MTDTTTTLQRLLPSVHAVLLDFDGTICSLFAALPAASVADRLNRLAATLHLPAQHHPTGPIRILRQAATANWQPLAEALREAEVEAAGTAAPTPGAHDAILTAWRTGRKVAVVSNNATEAVGTYLLMHGLERYVSHVAGRTAELHPTLLKPHGHLVNQALAALHVTPNLAVLVGDTVEDVQAGQTNGVSVIGFTRDAQATSSMLDAGAAAVLHTMADLSAALQLRVDTTAGQPDAPAPSVDTE